MDKYRKIYIIIMTFGLFISLLLVFISHGKNLSSFLFFDYTDTFMDFYNPIFHAHQANPYTEVDRIYPPICYVFFWILSQFIYSEALEMDGKYLSVDQAACFVFIVYNIITILLTRKVLEKLYVNESFKRIIMLLLIISGPFLFLYERANIIIISLILTIYFVLYKDDSSQKNRNIAIICISLAASIKIYPALFGILLIKEKRWIDILKCIILGSLFFFVPFAFMGGFDKISVMLSSLFSGSINTINIHDGLGYKVNFSNTVLAILTLCGFSISENGINSINLVATIFSIVMITGIIFINNKWKQICLICCLIIGMPSFSFEYTLIFLSIPLLIFLSKENEEKLDLIYCVLFSIIFIFFACPIEYFSSKFSGWWPLSLDVFLKGLSVLIMTLILYFDGFVNFIKMKKGNTAS